MSDKILLGHRKITDENGASVEITVGVPNRDENGSYYCEFSLDGLLWNGRIRRSYGIDAIQALYLALQSIGSDLEEFQQSGGLTLTWVGGSRSGDLGLPKIRTNNEEPRI